MRTTVNVVLNHGVDSRRALIVECFVNLEKAEQTENMAKRLANRYKDMLFFLLTVWTFGEGLSALLVETTDAVGNLWKAVSVIGSSLRETYAP